MHNVCKTNNNNHDSTSLHTRLFLRCTDRDDNSSCGDSDLADLQGLHPVDRSRDSPGILVRSELVLLPRMESIPSWRKKDAPVPKRHSLFFTTRVPVGTEDDPLPLANGSTRSIAKWPASSPEEPG